MGDRHLEDLQNQALAEPQAELAAGSQTVLPVAGMTAEPAEPAADKTAGSLPAARSSPVAAAAGTVSAAAGLGAVRAAGWLWGP